MIQQHFGKQLATLNGGGEFVLTYGVLPSGLSQVGKAATPNFSTGEIYLAINSPADGEGTGTQVATFDPTNLSNKWTNEVGEAEDSPCK